MDSKVFQERLTWQLAPYTHSMADMEELEELLKAETLDVEALKNMRGKVRDAWVRMDNARNQIASLGMALNVYADPDFYTTLTTPSTAREDQGQYAERTMNYVFSE